jgi:hypothetical protein
MADTLVEYQFNRHARIGAGQDRREGFLFLNRVLLQDRQVVLKRGQAFRSDRLFLPLIPAAQHRGEHRCDSTRERN